MMLFCPAGGAGTGAEITHMLMASEGIAANLWHNKTGKNII